VIYAFVCKKCGKPFDVRASVAEMDKGLSPQCPACGSKNVVQDFSGVGMVFRSPGGGSPPICGPGSGAGCC
jgi:putative FmdB family regulatory protein